MLVAHIIPDLKRIMYHIAKGLMLKEKIFRERDKGKYPDSPVLRRGLNELYLYATVNRCVDEKGDVLAPRNETEALLDYLSKPVKEWMDKWPEKSKQSAKDTGVWEWEFIGELQLRRETVCSAIPGKLLLKF